jgi:hypothetical protein
MPEEAAPEGQENERAFVIVGLVFVAIIPLFIPAAAGAFGIALALDRRGRRRQAALVALPAMFVFTAKLIFLLK